MGRRLLLCAVLALAALVLGPGVAMAEGQRSGGKVIRLDDQIIYGDVHGPSAVYVIQRTRPDHQPQEATPSFVQEVVRSVDGAPF